MSNTVIIELTNNRPRAPVYLYRSELSYSKKRDGLISTRPSVCKVPLVLELSQGQCRFMVGYKSRATKDNTRENQHSEEIRALFSGLTEDGMWTRTIAQARMRGKFHGVPPCSVLVQYSTNRAECYTHMCPSLE
jgi:hypothetical protein